MIYLDAAATTLEKPVCVHAAVAEALRAMSSPGRGNYPASRLAEETAFRCRSEAAAMFGADSPEKVIFTFNATHGLNIAIRSLLKPGGRVIISGYEHNAVTRPIHAIEGVENLALYSTILKRKRDPVNLSTDRVSSPSITWRSFASAAIIFLTSPKIPSYADSRNGTPLPACLPPQSHHAP